MSGPRWDHRRPNRAAWSLVGAVLSTTYLLAIYALPLWWFLAGWRAATSPESAAAHVALALAWALVGALGIASTWSRGARSARSVLTRVGIAVMTIASAVAVAQEGVPYVGWVWLMALWSTFVAVFGIGEWVTARRHAATTQVLN